MPPTKKSIRYRPGSTCGQNNCDRCLHFIRRNLFCQKLEKMVARERTCDLFSEDPTWTAPWIRHARSYGARK